MKKNPFKQWKTTQPNRLIHFSHPTCKLITNTKQNPNHTNPTIKSQLLYVANFYYPRVKLTKHISRLESSCAMCWFIVCIFFSRGFEPRIEAFVVRYNIYKEALKNCFDKLHGRIATCICELLCVYPCLSDTIFPNHIFASFQEIFIFLYRVFFVLYFIFFARIGRYAILRSTDRIFLVFLKFLEFFVLNLFRNCFL